MRVSNTNRSSGSVSPQHIYRIKPLVKRADGSWDLTVAKDGEPKTANLTNEQVGIFKGLKALQDKTNFLKEVGLIE